MKKFLITLCLLLSSVGIFAQKTIDNDFFSMQVPEGWKCIDMPLYEDTIGKMQLVILLNEADKYNGNAGIVSAYEKQLDLNTFLGEDEIKSRMESMGNNNAMEMGEIYSTSFWGKEAKARNFTMKKDGGVNCDGTMYAVYIKNYSVMIIEMSTKNMKTDFGKIWKTIQWKEFVNKDEDTDTLDTELEATVKLFNAMIGELPAQNGMKIEGFDLDTTSKILIFKISYIGLSKSDFSAEDLNGMNDFIKQAGPEMIKGFAENLDILNEALKGGYTFRMIVFDKDGKTLANGGIPYK